MKRLLLFSTLACAALLASTSARAQSQDAVTANELFEQGRQAMKKDDYAVACAKFLEAWRLDPRVGTALNLTYCEERLGHLASARTYAQEAQRLARALHDDREKEANARYGELDPKVPRLTVRLGQSACPGTTIVRDGLKLGPATLGAALPVDAGKHTIVASAPGCDDVRSDVTLAIGEERAMEVATRHRAGEEDVPSRTPALILAGAAVVGVGVGAAFGLSALSKKRDSDDFCSGTVCQQHGLDLRDDAKTSATISTISFAVGIACLAAAGYFWFSSAPAKVGANGARAAW